MAPRTLALAVAAGAAAAAAPPNIVFILADDFGWNDASYHGSPQVPTPHIDAIGAAGVTLNRYYTQPVCSPTRASLMTGRHAIHHGVYVPFAPGLTAEHLNTSFTTLPQYLAACCNYSSHMVGKWHLGGAAMAQVPTSRGFATHMGYLSGAEDHQTHIPDDLGVYDFFDGLTPLVAANGTFSTGLFTEAAVARLTAQAAAGPDAQPLYLYLAMQNIHVPLQAPPEYVARYPPSATGNNTLRAAICAMIAYLDDAVGNVTAAVTALGLDGNTIVIFASDNGGPTNGAEGTEANNFPLRGGKNTIWEGGTRVAAMVKGPGIPAGVTTDALVHVTDWLPSLVSAAGGGNFTRWAPPGEPAYQPGDGLDVWATIASGGATPSPRDWVLLEAHPPGTAGLTHGDALLLADPSDGSLYKVIANGPASTATEDGWWPPPGQDAATTPYTLRCDYDGRGPRTGAATSLKECAYPDACVYNLTGDPCEYHNIAADQPALAARLHAALAVYQATAVPPTMGTGCKPRVVQVAGSAGGNASAYQPCDAPPLLPPGPSR